MDVCYGFYKVRRKAAARRQLKVLRVTLWPSFYDICDAVPVEARKIQPAVRLVEELARGLEAAMRDLHDT